MTVSSLENFRITRDNGFNVQGFETRQRKKVQRMEPGDRLLYYLNGVCKFAAAATVAETYFEEHSQVWVSEHGTEDFPYRVKITVDSALEEGQFLDAFQIGPRMEYVRKWPPEDWPLAFIGALHLVPKNDFFFIENEMRRVAGHKLPIGTQFMKRSEQL